MHVNVFLEKSILDDPSIGDGAKNTSSFLHNFFPMRALIFQFVKITHDVQETFEKHIICQ